ncbi:hypothetical protein B2G71_10365 [Novosphingobium sp. PC22D]|uniref:hypothetical protein n=1 Tax=Novosphingobium sp. PC22D TaxID=1962403 RepID=UPI000BF14AF7|nr:hypothetical protein [Novosphingobium sp. PC22D]PEQ12701.1 hypothetical protein B2G71_10365 [Novosphingobium sp. PC22D]
MLPVFLTIDTEFSSGMFARGEGRDWQDNFARCLSCETTGGEVGIFYQMDVADRHGLKLVFFVDPMPALVWGIEPIKRVVGPVLDRGHDVQLHLHPEWLAFAQTNPLGTRTGRNLADFTREEQLVLLAWAVERLTAAGAPRPVAFRAGNYGADDNTLHCLGELGIAFDTSFPPGIGRSDCRLSFGSETILPVARHGVTELPIGAIGGRGLRRRHAQLTAMSQWELRSATRHAQRSDWPAFVLVSHSFEMMNRARGTANRIVQTRFERYCAWLAAQPGIETCDFRDAARNARLASTRDHQAARLMPYNPAREIMRIGEQALANALY